MNTAILLGAGASVAAGFPSTNNLTERVLSGTGGKRHTDGSYFVEGTGLHRVIVIQLIYELGTPLQPFNIGEAFQA